MKLKLSIIFTFCSYVLIGQNSENFFKTVPIIKGTEANWIQEMYSENPNVYEVVRQYEAHYKDNEFVKNIHTQNYKYWINNTIDYLDDEGYIQQNDPKRELRKKIRREQAQQEKSLKSVDIWSSIGPFETYALDDQLGVIPVSWQANVFCFDQSASNPNVVVAGTSGAGAWKSVDKGLNWYSITHDEDFSNIHDIKVAPSDENIIFISNNSNVVKSTDGGLSWSTVLNVSGTYQIVIHPVNPDIVMVLGSNGLQRSTNGGNSWSTIYTTRCWDINFHPTNPAIVYLLRHNSILEHTEFWKSTDTGTTWNQVTNGWFDPVNPSFTEHRDIGSLIAVTPLEPNKVYVGIMGNHKAEDNAWIGVYRSEDEGESWVNPIQDGGPYDAVTNPNLGTSGLEGGFTQGFYDFGFDASHTVPGRLYLGIMGFSVSSDSGNSWTRIGAYSAASADNVGWIHPDIQDVHVFGSDVWLATDGGINYSNDEFATHVSLKKGISGSHFWGVDQAWNEDVIVGGKYHNGNMALYSAYGTGNATRLGGAEAPTGYADIINPFLSYFSDINSKIIHPTDVGLQENQSKLSKYPHESFFHGASSEIVRDPRYGHHLYLGAASDTQDGGFWKSTDNGLTFELLHDFGPAKVTGIEISRQNPDILYCVYNHTEVYKTTDGGHNWTQTASLPTTGRKLISINPSNDQELWVFAHTSNNTNKVFRTTNSGANWDNMTTSTLSGMTINDGVFQGGTDNIVYIIGSHDLMYWDDMSNDWVDYREGLPFVLRDVKTVFKPFYKDGKLRLSSVRGIWEAPFVEPSMPVAQPITLTDIVGCSRDTIQFDDYSMLNHNGAQWQWTFSPQPRWINSSTIRNPKVLLDDGISYDVTLEITDGNNMTDQKTIANMVTVMSQCEVSDSPTNALENTAVGDWAQLSDFDINTNSMTISAWVKPEGIQPNFSGIVFNDGTSAGFNFNHSNNTLGYHWPGGSWSWNSGLQVPPGEWSYVAMVATPTGMTLYVNGIASTHTANLGIADLGTMKIGSYKGWGSRNFIGQIDEVCIWNRSLSQAEIREHRHLTKIPQNDPTIIAYYQFNQDSNVVFDQVGFRHGNLSGGAKSVLSTASVGGGQVSRLTVNNPGIADFSDAAITLDFPSSGALPDGEIVAFQLNVDPHNSPGNFPIPEEGYYIINNYGANSTFAELSSIAFGNTSLSINSGADYNNLALYKRPSNAYGPSWTLVDNADAVNANNNGTVSFSNGNGISSFSQFIILQDEMIGSPCDDAIDCTINDVFNLDLECTGELQDIDNDGICDIDDDCNSPYVSDLDPIPGSMSNNWGPIEFDANNGGSQANNGTQMSIGGVTYDKGIGVHSLSSISYATNSVYTILSGFIGLDDHCVTAGSVQFEVYLDGNLTYLSPIVGPDDVAIPININIQDVDTVRLATNNGGDDNIHDWANWADLKFEDCDLCPDDPLKTEPGLCGCGVLEIDSDNDGVCDANDICPGGDDTIDDDGDGIPDFCDDCISIENDDFETNAGIWIVGGQDAERVNSLDSPSGNFSMRIRDNSFEASSIYTDPIDLSQVNEFIINFDFKAVSMDPGEEFFLELSNDGASTFTIVEDWISGTDFNNDVVYNETIQIDQQLLSSTTIIRFRCNGGINDDEVFIDNIILETCLFECQDVIIENLNGISSTSQSVITSIESNNIINSGTNIEYNAGQYILLTAGFEIKANAVFHAFILGCE